MFVVIVIAIVILIDRAAKDRFDVPVDVYVCGSPVDLATVQTGIAPTGCVAVPNGVQLSMDNPDKEAHAYTDGFFGFRVIPSGSSEATLTATGAIESSTISFVAIDDDGSSRQGEMTPGPGINAVREWTAPLTLSSDLARLSIYIVTSPDSPPANA
jgi:hypothetical protein